jgi:hypothetical protein
MTKTVTVLSGLIRPLVEGRLPDWVEPRFFTTKDQAMAMAPEAEIGWFDMYDKDDMAETITAATRLKWLNSIYAGVDGMPLDLLAERGTVVTNGAGINAITIAEYVVMGMLTVAKGYREVVRAQDRREWLMDSPGKVELFGSKALLLGYGAIGKLIDERLKGFAVDVTIVRRSPPKDSGGPNTLTPDQWRAKLGDFDWVILAVPATPETDGMISRAVACRRCAVEPRQCACHDAPVGPCAGQDVRPLGPALPRKSGPVAQGRNRRTAGRPDPGLLIARTVTFRSFRANGKKSLPSCKGLPCSPFFLAAPC